MLSNLNLRARRMKIQSAAPAEDPTRPAHPVAAHVEKDIGFTKFHDEHNNDLQVLKSDLKDSLVEENFREENFRVLREM